MITVAVVVAAAMAVASPWCAADQPACTAYADGARWQVVHGGVHGGRTTLRARTRPAGFGGMPVETARRALRSTARLLYLDADTVDTLPLVRRRESISGTHLTFEGRAGGLPVDGCTVTVHTDRAGTVRLIRADRADLHGSPPPQFVRTESRIVETAFRHLDVRDPLRGQIEVRRVAYPAGKSSVRAGWRVTIPATSPLGDWDVLVDDETLDVVEVNDLLMYADGSGRVFIPNPVVALHDHTLEDWNDNNGAVPEAAYTFVTLRELDGSGYLTGPFVATTPTTNRACEEPPFSFKYNREDDRFEEVMAYYHIDSYQRYIQDTLGFDNACNKRVLVNVNGTTQDQSYYSPATGTITLGSGGVDDGEDADIIVHEYGHAIQHDIIHNFGSSHEAASIAEALSDYFAASYFADDYDTYWPTLIGEWDATSYTSWRPAYLRRVDSTKVYPRDIEGEEHADGEIYSSALWSVRSSVGQTVADRIVIESMFYMPGDVTFLGGLDAMLIADEHLYDSAYADVITASFDARGIAVPVPIEGDVFTRDEEPDRPIPDNKPVGITSRIYVSSDVTISAMTVTVDITHTYIGDLEIWLRAPWGQEVTLHDRSGGAGHDLHTTYGLDRLPDGPGSLDDYVGAGSLGTWTLAVRDMAQADTGTLNWWQLEIAPRAPVPPPPPVIETNGGMDFETDEPIVRLAGTTVAGTVSVEVNGSIEGVTFEYGTEGWQYDGPLVEGENRFEVTALSETAESAPRVITVTYRPAEHSKYDVNRDGHIDPVDLQRVINIALGLPPMPGDVPADFNGDATVDAVDVQLCVNAVLGV